MREYPIMYLQLVEVMKVSNTGLFVYFELFVVVVFVLVYLFAVLVIFKHSTYFLIYDNSFCLFEKKISLPQFIATISLIDLIQLV